MLTMFRRKAVSPELLREFRKALKLSSILGGSSLSLSSQHRLRIVPWKLAYSILCASPILLVTTCVYIVNFVPRKGAFAEFLISMQAIPLSLATASYLYCTIVYRGVIDDAFQKLVKIDNLLSDLNAKPNINYYMVYGAASMMCGLIQALAGALITKNTSSPRIVVMLIFPYSFCYLFGVLELFLFLVDSLWEYLDALVRHRSSTEAVLVRLCAVHDGLADVRANIQKVYGFPVLLILSFSFVFVVTNIFLSLKTKIIEVKILFIVGMVLGTISLARVAYSCGRTTAKGNEFYSVLHKIMKADESCKLLYNVYSDAHLTKKKSFVFSAAGFFKLDLKLIGKFIAATTTLSVIFIQMG